MAQKAILPGFGSQVVSETFSALSIASVGADTYDMSKCLWFSVQLISSGGAGAGFQVQQTFGDPSSGGTTWFSLGAAVTGLTLFDSADGPFGTIRFSVSISASTASAILTGFAQSISW